MDIRTFTFDWSLTFSALVMHPDGTVYHRYGSRDAASASSHLSETSLVRLLDGALEEHREYAKNPRPPRTKPLTPEEQPHWKRRIEANERPDCFHCHMVGEGYAREARERKRWRPDMVWRYPSPDRIGLGLDRDDQVLVTEVAAGTPAARAGLREGDRLVRAAEQRVRTMTDLAHVLDGLPGKATSLALAWRRGDEEKKATLRLASGWKVGTPLDLAWRSDMWALSPKPGFGGRMLTAERKEQLGIDPQVGAFEVAYIVTWGENRHTGRNAQRAGIRKGDVVVAVDGKSDFATETHFHAWFRLTRKAGEEVEVEVLRGGKRHSLTLPVVD